MSVMGVVISSSPGSRSRLATAMWMAAVHEEAGMQCFTPCIAPNRSQKALTLVPQA